MTLLPISLKLWLLAAGAFVLGLLGLYRGIKKSGREEAYREVDAARAVSRQQARTIAAELEVMDDQGLADAAKKWTRRESGGEER